jgi:hypothetical protein
VRCRFHQLRSNQGARFVGLSRRNVDEGGVSRSRTSCGIRRRHSGIQRQRNGDSRAGARRAVDLELASQARDAIAQAEQPAPIGPRASDAVIAHVDPQLPSSTRAATLACCAPECFATFVSVSATMK